MMSRLHLLLAFILCSFSIRASYRGYPDFTVYNPEDYGFHAQTFGIYQDSSGMMYFANVLGLVNFDGRNWSHIKNTRSESVYSVAKGLGESVAYGGDGDFGYAEKKQGGAFIAKSLLDFVPKADRDFQEIWTIISHSTGTLYCSKNAIFRWDGRKISVYHPRGPRGFHKFFSVGDRVIVREFETGLLEWKPEGLTGLTGGDFFSEIKVDFIYPMNGRWRVGTRDKGFFEFDPSGLNPVRPAHSEAGDFISSAVLYHGIRLHDGNFAYATHKRGVIICDESGRILENYDSRILQSNKTWFLHQDRDKNLWIANDRAICTADYAYPLRWFARNQLTTNAVATDKAGRVWVAATDGLYSSRTGLPTDSFSLHIQSLGHYFTVLNFKYGAHSSIIASSQHGLQFFGGNSETVMEDNFSFSHLRQWKRDSSLVVGIGRGGMAVFQFRNKGWEKVFYDDSLDGQLYAMTEDASGRIWITGEDGLVICLSLTPSKTNILQKTMFRFPSDSPFKAENFRCFSLNGRLFFTGIQTIMEYRGRSPGGDLRFSVVTDFSSGLKGSFDFFRIYESSNGLIWISGDEHTGKNIHGYLYKNARNEFDVQGVPFSKLKIYQVNAFCESPDGTVWLACNNGVVSFDSGKKISYASEFPVLLNVMTPGIPSNSFLSELAAEELVLPYSQNKLNFYYQALSYGAPASLSYSVFLEGLDVQWSRWESVNTMAYNSLPEGKYVFHVKGRDIYGNVSKESILAFEILPPLYRTWWAYISYLIIGILGVRQIVKFNTARLKSLNEYLDRTVSQRTQELKIEKEKLSEANREITDSINYARFIQRSILPAEDFIHGDLRGSFIYYKPRDIVSGDFYWFDQIEDSSPPTQIIVLADCTGHGVPGAFMSMIGSEKLNQAVHDLVNPDPSKMLVFMNQSVTKAMRKGGSTESRDGMEMGICFFRPGNNFLQYAGANRPLWVYRKEKHDFEIIKPTKCGIAGGSDTGQAFALHEVPLRKGDRVFMFSDGAPDQFGGLKGRKLTTKGFRDLLLEIQQYDILDQKRQIDLFYSEWMKDQEQVDDILIMGFEV